MGLAVCRHPMMAGQERKMNMAKITLKAARVNAGLTQKGAADKIGISNKTLHNWENGRSFPDVMQVNALCEAYGVLYDDIIFLPSDSL